MSLKNLYFQERDRLLNNTNEIVRAEESFQDELVHNVLANCFASIHREFSISPVTLLRFWQNYPPEQRGRQPMGHSVPWLELGEKVLAFNIISELSKRHPNLKFHGLPTGGDMRFTLPGLYIHLDIKMTGPNDNPNEVVVPPNQVSGAGEEWNEHGVLNSSFPIHYQSRSKSHLINYWFQPKLPPFYIIDGKPHLTITAFIDAIYDVQGFGNHPLKKLEMSIVPNGLIMFDTKRLAETPGLLIAGKDDKTVPDDSKRVRVRLDPLSTIDSWRSIQMITLDTDGNYEIVHR
jgi:hypothetical protein